MHISYPVYVSMLLFALACIFAFSEGAAALQTEKDLITLSFNQQTSHINYKSLATQSYSMLDTKSPSNSLFDLNGLGDPSANPTSSPSFSPSSLPSSKPSSIPSSPPTLTPISSPTFFPTRLPTSLPTSLPTRSPSTLPSALPTVIPSANPSAKPTLAPSLSPTIRPTPSPNTYQNSYVIQPQQTSSIHITQNYPTVRVNFDLSLTGGQYVCHDLPLTASQAQTQFTISWTNFGAKHYLADIEVAFKSGYFGGNDILNVGTNQIGAFPTNLMYRGVTGISTCATYSFSGFSLSSTNVCFYNTCGNGPPCSDATRISGQFELEGYTTTTPTNITKASTNCLLPTAAPTFQPTGQPTGQPSYQTTNYTRILNIKVLSTAKTSVNIFVTLNANTKRTTGTLYCFASTNSSLSSIVSSPMSLSSPIVNIYFSGASRGVTLTLTGLRPSTTYYAYCRISASDGASTSPNSIARLKATFATPCCIDISFTNAPKYIFNDITIYQPSTPRSQYVFTYSLSYPPLSTITIVPVLTPINSDYSAAGISIFPPYSTFTSTRPLTGAFTISGKNSLGGRYFLSLNVTNGSNKLYSAQSIGLAIIPATGPLPPPVITKIQLSNNAIALYAYFDVLTNRANIQTFTFPCSTLFQFQYVASTTCTWINSSTVQLTVNSNSLNRVSSILIPGLKVSFISRNVQAECLPRSNCTLNGRTSPTNLVVQSPENPPVPDVKLSGPSVINTCSDLFIDASASTGNGGRPWRSIQWSTNVGNGSPIVRNRLNQYLVNYGIASGSFSIPSNILPSNGDFSITLTLTNFLNNTGFATFTGTVSNLTNLPNIQIVGGNDVSFTPYQSISIRVTGTPSPCGNSSSIVFTRSIFENGVLLPLQSVSLDPRNFKLNPYSLAAGKTYNVVFTATAPGISKFPSATTTTSASVTIESGDVIALIAGGRTRQVALGVPVTLDASSSYDENSRVSPLSYLWSCSVSSLNNFGNDCSFIFGSSVESSTVEILSTELNVTMIYSVSVQVTSSDLRMGVDTTYLQGIRSTIATNIITTSTFFNAGSSVSLSASINGAQSLTGNVLARWSISESGYDITNTLNPWTSLSESFSSSEARSGILYPVAFRANSFSPGLTYTLRLSAYSDSTPSLVTYSEIDIVINSPPSNGIVTVSPTFGISLTTVFSISGIQWVTSSEGLPLQYVFTCQKSNNSYELTISSRSILNSVTTILPPGQPSEDYSILISNYAYDSFNAFSVVTTTITVEPAAAIQSLDNRFELSDFTGTPVSAISQIDNAFQSGDIDAAVRYLNIFSSSFYLPDCSNANSTYCASLNRGGCTTTPNTCGSCLSGYSGVVGPFNGRCIAVKGANPLDCQSSSDCLYGPCINGTCTVSEKMCPSSNNNQCSGKGKCRFIDPSNVEVPTCLVTNTLCQAICSCDSGYYGADCSMNYTAQSTRDQFRNQLCEHISTAITLQDPSGSLLDTLVSSLKTSFVSYDITSNQTKSTCLNALTSLITVANQGYLSSSQSNTYSVLLSILSDFINAGVFTSFNESSTEVSNDLASTLTDLLVEGYLSTLVEGQQALSLTSDYVQMSVLIDRPSRLLNSSISPPLTYASESYGNGQQFISFTSNADLSSCSNSGGYNRLALTQWSINPIPSSNSDQIKTPLLKITSQSSGGTSNSTLSSPDIQFYITLQFSYPQDFNLSLNLLDAPKDLIVPDNTTIPQCTALEDSAGAYSTCRSCNVSSYTQLSVTFACSDISLLCQSQSSRRSLSDTLTSRALSSTDDVSSSIFGSVTTSFASTLSRSPFSFSAQEAESAAVFIGSLVFLLLVGMAIFINWDRLDHDYIIYVKKDDRILKLHSDWKLLVEEQKNSKGKGKRHTHGKDKVSKDSSLQGYSSAIPVNKFKRLDAKFKSNDKSKLKTGGKITWVESTRSFFDSTLQADVLLSDFGSIYLLQQSLLFRHDFAAPFYGPSLRSRRALRYFRVMYAVILAIFVDTVFFNEFYPDQGTCEGYSTYSDCTSAVNLATNSNQCVWNENSSNSQGGICRLNTPPTSILFTFVLAFLTVIVALPFLVLAEIIIDEVCSRRPILEDIGLTSDSWFGSLTSITTVQNPKPKLANIFPRLVGLSSETEDRIRQRNSSIATSADRELEELSKNALHIYHDQLSVEEEAGSIISHIIAFLRKASLGRIHYFADDTDESLKTRDTSSKSTDSLTSTPNDQLLRNIAKIVAINETFGINIDGSAVPLTLLERIFYNSPFQRICSKIETSRQQCGLILQGLKGFSHNEDGLKNEFIIHHFVLEQFSFFKRYCLRKQLFKFDDTSPEPVNVFTWLLAWAYLILSLAFFIYYIFVWTAVNAGNTISFWAVNFAIGLIQDIFFVQILRVYITYVAGIISCKNQLKNIHRTLSSVALRVPHINLDVDPSNEHIDNNFRVVQHISGSCRVARKKSVSDLLASQILRVIDDLDVKNCRETGNASLGWFVALLLLIPGFFAVSNESVSKFFMQTTFQSMISGLLIAHGYLLSISPLAIAAPYVVAAIILVLKIMVYDPIIKRRRQRLEAEAKAQQLHQLFKRKTSWVSKALDALGVVLSAMSSEIHAEKRKREKAMNLQWLRVNQSSTSLSYIHDDDKDDEKAGDINSTKPLFELTNVPDAVKKIRPPTTPLRLPEVDWFIITAPSLIASQHRATKTLNEAEVRRLGLVNMFNVYENISSDESGKSSLFRDNHITSRIEEALRRFIIILYSIQGRHSHTDVITKPVAKKTFITELNSFTLKSKQIVGLTYVESVNLVSTYNKYHSIEEYAFLLEVIWQTYRPNGIPLSREESDEVLDAFVQWSDSESAGGEGVYFQYFASWFVDTMDRITTLRENNNAKVQFVDQLEVHPFFAYKSASTSPEDGKDNRNSSFRADEEYLEFNRLYKASSSAGISPDPDYYRRRKNSFAQSLHSPESPSAQMSIHNQIRKIIFKLAAQLSSSSAKYDESFAPHDLMLILGEFLRSSTLFSLTEQEVKKVEDQFASWVTSRLDGEEYIENIRRESFIDADSLGIGITHKPGHEKPIAISEFISWAFEAVNSLRSLSDDGSVDSQRR